MSSTRIQHLKYWIQIFEFLYLEAFSSKSKRFKAILNEIQKFFIEI